MLTQEYPCAGLTGKHHDAATKAANRRLFSYLISGAESKAMVVSIAGHMFITETSDPDTRTRFRIFVEFLAGKPHLGDGDFKVVRFDDSQSHQLHLVVNGSKDTVYLLHLRLREAFPELDVQKVE